MNFSVYCRWWIFHNRFCMVSIFTSANLRLLGHLASESNYFDFTAVSFSNNLVPKISVLSTLDVRIFVMTDENI